MAVAKSFRHKKNDMYTVKEFKKIEGIRNLLPPKMKSTLPKPFSLKVIENYSVAFYEAFGGETLLARSKKETGFFTTGRIDFILQGTADWLFSFQKSIKNGKSLETENCKIPLRILNQRIQNKNRLSSLLEAESFLEKQNSLPSHPAQGDFWMGNIFYTGKGIGVVDWEFFDTTDLPLFDLFFLITTLSWNTPASRNPDGINRKEGFYFYLFTESLFGKIALKILNQYAYLFNIPPGNFEDLFLLFLATMATREERTFGQPGETDFTWQELLQFYLKMREKKKPLWV